MHMREGAVCGIAEGENPFWQGGTSASLTQKNEKTTETFVTLLESKLWYIYWKVDGWSEVSCTNIRTEISQLDKETISTTSYGKQIAWMVA